MKRVYVIYSEDEYCETTLLEVHNDSVKAVERARELNSIMREQNKNVRVYFEAVKFIE